MTIVLIRPFQASKSATAEVKFMQEHYSHVPHGKWEAIHVRGFTPGPQGLARSSVETRITDVESKLTQLDGKLDKVIDALARIEDKVN